MGSVTRLITDDKGTRFLIAFGMPGQVVVVVRCCCCDDKGTRFLIAFGMPGQVRPRGVCIPSLLLW